MNGDPPPQKKKSLLPKCITWSLWFLMIRQTQIMGILQNNITLKMSVSVTEKLRNYCRWKENKELLQLNSLHDPRLDPWTSWGEGRWYKRHWESRHIFNVDGRLNAIVSTSHFHLYSVLCREGWSRSVTCEDCWVKVCGSSLSCSCCEFEVRETDRFYPHC